MSTNYVWADDEIPAIQQNGEYKALAAAILEKWSRGKSLKYVMPIGRDDEKLLYMGLKPLMVDAGFASIRIRHKKGPDGKNVQEQVGVGPDNKPIMRDVFLLFPKPKDAAAPAAQAPVPMPQIPATTAA